MIQSGDLGQCPSGVNALFLAADHGGVDVRGFEVADDVAASAEQGAGDSAGDDEHDDDDDDGLEGDALLVGAGPLSCPSCCCCKLGSHVGRGADEAADALLRRGGPGRRGARGAPTAAIQRRCAAARCGRAAVQTAAEISEE